MDKDFTKVEDLMIVYDANSRNEVLDYLSKDLEKAREDEANYYVPSRRELKAKKESLSR